jgi:uncharacterized protein (DUF2235 family)
MAEIATTPSGVKKKRIALFLDGTWNKIEDATNIWRLRALCAPLGNDGQQQVTYYSLGLGTHFGERLRGGAFGYGLDAAIIEAYEWLIGHFEGADLHTGAPDAADHNDEIFIFGFSRGAYTARSLAGLISKFGLLIPGAPLSVKQLYLRYRNHQASTLHELRQKPPGELSLEERWLLKYAREIRIKFIGVFDTVGALGVPFHIPGFDRHAYRFLDTNLRQTYENAFQALAIDEHREAYDATLWTTWSVKPGATPPRSLANTKPRPLSQVEQRWFAGAHSNVGGGYTDDLIAQIPLKWMASKASSLGLTFRSGIDVDGDVNTCAVRDSFARFLLGAYKVMKLGHPYYRELARAPSERPTTFMQTINETIDVSVFERWRKNEDYRRSPPANLTQWAQRQGVRVEDIQTSVRADNPREAVAD